MVVIDDLKFNVIIPDILIEYLKGKGIDNVFIIDGNNYILNSGISDENKNIILNMSLFLIGNEVGQYVLENEILMNEFNKINIYYADRRAADLFKRGNVSRANEILKNKISEIQKFKNNILMNDENISVINGVKKV